MGLAATFWLFINLFSFAERHRESLLAFSSCPLAASSWMGTNWRRHFGPFKSLTPSHPLVPKSFFVSSPKKSLFPNKASHVESLTSTPLTCPFSHLQHLWVSHPPHPLSVSLIHTLPLPSSLFPYLLGVWMDCPHCPLMLSVPSIS